MVQSRRPERPRRRDPASPRGRRDDVRGRNRHRAARSPGVDGGVLKDPVQDKLWDGPPPVARRAKGGGAGGIRTLDRALQPYNGLANRRLQPLGHSSVEPDMPDAGMSRKRQITGCLIPSLLVILLNPLA